MKTCPYCKESIQDDAIKCKHCHSMLLPIEAQTKPEVQGVTYVVDRDLVRFGKFAGAILGVFVIVGVYLFGFKLDVTLEKAHKAEDDIKTAEASLKEAQAELDKAEKGLAESKAQIEETNARANILLKEIEALKIQAETYINFMKLPSPQQVAAREEVRSESPEKFREGSTKYWPNGMKLRIRFLGGSQDKHAAVMLIAQEWTRFANVRFERSDDPQSEVRVSFVPGSSWSYVGTDALGVSTDQPTMNLGWIEKKNVLHEFGHVLGLIEELQNPHANIPWNKQLVLQELGGAPNFWPQRLIEAKIFAKVSAEELPDYRDFDPLSIMVMAVPKEWTGGLALGEGDTFSEGDKAFIQKLYPRT